MDLLPLYLKARADNAEPMYLVSDGHWSDRAQRIAAADIGARLRRYDFVRAALKQKPLFTSAPVQVSFRGATFKYLTAAEREEAARAVGAMSLTHVTSTDGGQPFVEPAESPVVVIGDSFTHYFQTVIKAGSGIDALLSKEINIPVPNVSTAGGTTAPIKDFLRRPELLRGRRVVVLDLQCGPAGVSSIGVGAAPASQVERLTAPPASRPRQKLMIMPMSTFRGFWTAVGFRKNGDVITPLKPVRFAWLVRLLTLVYRLSLYRWAAGGPAFV